MSTEPGLETASAASASADTCLNAALLESAQRSLDNSLANLKWQETKQTNLDDRGVILFDDESPHVLSGEERDWNAELREKEAASAGPDRKKPKKRGEFAPSGSASSSAASAVKVEEKSLEAESVDRRSAASAGPVREMAPEAESVDRSSAAPSSGADRLEEEQLQAAVAGEPEDMLQNAVALLKIPDTQSVPTGEAP